MKRLRPAETAVLVAGLLALSALVYRQSQWHTLEKAWQESRKALGEIHETQALQRIWEPRGLAGKLQQLKSLLPANHVKRFALKSHQLELMIDGVDGQQLNRFLGRLGSLPVQITTLQILRAEHKYRLECRCKW